MNGLLKLRKDMAIVDAVPFKYLLYMAMLSDVVPMDEDGTRYAVCSIKEVEFYDDYFPEWNSDSRTTEVTKAMDELVDEGLIRFDDDFPPNQGIIYLGEFRGRRFFPFEKKDSTINLAKEAIEEALKDFNSTPRRVSRAKYIKSQIREMLEKGVDSMTPGDFTELHGYLYEIYTGGENYILRNKTEQFQTTNMLKAYNKQTTFALIVEGTLHYDKYRKHGVPTITNVACMKDDVFRSLTKGGGSKDYMRDADDNSEF